MIVDVSRAWHVLDLTLLLAPGLHWYARANLITGAMITALAHTVNLGRSTRARRGFISLVIYSLFLFV